MNIIVGTAILWGITAVFVVPLTAYLVKRKLDDPAYAHLRGEELSQENRAALGQLERRCYILVDMAVLGAAGLVLGIIGYWFVGISLKAEGWPGMIAFIAASFVGVGLRSGLAPVVGSQF